MKILKRKRLQELQNCNLLMKEQSEIPIPSILCGYPSLLESFFFLKSEEHRSTARGAQSKELGFYSNTMSQKVCFYSNPMNQFQIVLKLTIPERVIVLREGIWSTQSVCSCESGKRGRLVRVDHEPRPGKQCSCARTL